MIGLRIPWPPSINYYYRILRKFTCKKCGHKAWLPPPYITTKARQFRKRVEKAAEHINPIGDKRIAVRVDLYPPADKGDVDNYIKPTLDALQHAGVFDDDSQVKDLRLVWHHPVPKGAADVKIWEIQNVGSE